MPTRLASELEPRLGVRPNARPLFRYLTADLYVMPAGPPVFEDVEDGTPRDPAPVPPAIGPPCRTCGEPVHRVAVTGRWYHTRSGVRRCEWPATVADPAREGDGDLPPHPLYRHASIHQQQAAHRDHLHAEFGGGSTLDLP